MAKYFTEKDIEEFRECFSFHMGKKSQITTAEELSQIIRSLGFSPTAEEIPQYFKRYAIEGKIDFARFLDIMKTHSDCERCSDEILDAFRLYDTHKSGLIPATELRNILLQFGEKLSIKEVDTLFREANISRKSQVKYADFLRLLFTPIPDY